MDVHRRWALGATAAISVVLMAGCSSDTGAGASGGGPPLSVDAGNGDAANGAPAQTDPQNQANISAASSIAVSSIAVSSIVAGSGDQGTGSGAGSTPDTAGDVAMGNQGTNQGVGQSPPGGAGSGATRSTMGTPGVTSADMTAMTYARIVVANLRQMPAGGAPTMSNLQQVAQLVKAPATVEGIADANGDGTDDDGRLTITMSGGTACATRTGSGWTAADGACPVG